MIKATVILVVLAVAIPSTAAADMTYHSYTPWDYIDYLEERVEDLEVEVEMLKSIPTYQHPTYQPPTTTTPPQPPTTTTPPGPCLSLIHI